MLFLEHELALPIRNAVTEAIMKVTPEYTANASSPLNSIKGRVYFERLVAYFFGQVSVASELWSRSVEFS